MVYYVDSTGCVHMMSNALPEQRVIAQKRAKEPSLRTKCVVSLEAARRVIDEWVKANS